MIEIYNILFFWSSYFNTLDDFGLAFLRLAIGSIFLIHGASKFAMWKMAPTKDMTPTMLNILRFLSIAETIGALAILLGFMTQFVAIGLSAVMLSAIYFKKQVWKTKFTTNEGTGWEFDLMVFAGCITLLTLGSGGLSIDRILLGL